MFRCIGEHISLDLFYFVSLTCYCSLIVQYSVVVVFTIGNFPRDHQAVLSQIIINVTILQTWPLDKGKYTFSLLKALACSRQGKIILPGLQRDFFSLDDIAHVL